VAWAKGKSGNPNGRPPKGRTVTDALRAFAEKEGKNKQEAKDALAEVLWKLALAGDVAAIKYIYDRLDGRPKETHEITGDDGGPIQIVYDGDFNGI